MKLNDFQILCNPISGRQLLEIYPDYLKMIFPNFVSSSPGIAIQKIKKRFQVHPATNGNNVQGIVVIRDRLFNIAEQNEFVNAFAIVASHTHWVDHTPIIYRYFEKENQYIIGTHKINTTSTYHPVSFAFHNDYPLAYEWCEGLPIREKEFEIALRIVNNLNAKIKSEKYPLGISIDFRFKKALFENSIPSVELPIDEVGHKFFGYSKIITRANFQSIRRGEEIEQVAWHPFSDLSLELSNKELEVLNNLRLFVGSNNQESVLEKIHQIRKLVKSEKMVS